MKFIKYVGICFFIICLLSCKSRKKDGSTVLSIQPLDYHSKTSESAGQTYFFHWGSQDSNEGLLRLGGFPFGDEKHSEKINSGKFAVLDERVMKIIRSAGSDRAGPGIYVSENPGDSSSFGTDLLIFHLRDKNNQPLILNIDENIGWNVPQDIQECDFSSFPFFTSYMKSEKWIVISRGPNADEDIIATYGPPSVEDVTNFLKEFTQKQRQDVFKILAISTEAIFSMVYQEVKFHEMTPSSRIFIHRLLFDAGFEYLKSLNQTEDLSAEECGYLKYHIKKAFELIIPNDERTKFLQDWKCK